MDDDRFDALTRETARPPSRRRVLRGLAGGLAAAILGGRLADAAAQGNSSGAKACQKGGYATHVRGDGARPGEGFATVGECVSYVNQGGKLKPRGLLGATDPCSIAHSYVPGTNEPSLASLNLGICDLSDLNLAGANLTNASIINGYLPGAILDGANMAGANLLRANLNSATLKGASLLNAILDEADLAYADLFGANLSGAALNGAILDEVVWGNTTCPNESNSDANGGTCVGHL